MKKIEIRVDQEGSRGYMWHAIDSDGADFLVSSNNYLSTTAAGDSAVDIFNKINETEINIVTDLPDDPAPPHDGRREFAPNTFYIMRSMNWCADEGPGEDVRNYYGILTLGGPMSTEAVTYYHSLESIMTLSKWICIGGFEISQITEEIAEAIDVPD